MKLESARLGLPLALLTAGTFSMSGSLASSLIDAGWSPAAAVTGRVTLAALVLTPAALITLRGRWRLLREAAPTVAAFGLVAVAACQFAFFSAVYFNQNLTAALVYVNVWCASLCAAGQWVYLEKHGGQWVRRSGLTIGGA